MLTMNIVFSQHQLFKMIFDIVSCYIRLQFMRCFMVYITHSSLIISNTQYPLLHWKCLLQHNLVKNNHIEMNYI